VVISALLAAETQVGGVFDDNPAKWAAEILGVRVMGPVASLLNAGFRKAVLAIGDNQVRCRLAGEIDIDWITVIHPHTWIDPSVRIGAGTVVLAGAVIQPDTVIGSHVIINTAVSIDHDCVIGDFVHLAPGVHLPGGVTVGEGAFLGIAAAATPGTKIGSWATVGAGAVVVNEVPSRETYVGVPAKALKRGHT
jgi:sugar O-acyltransferase (sialic acid O-acetyltransferase NeuD family)